MSADLSFEQVVRDNQAMVFRTLYRLTGSREHLEDLAQEVFLRLYRSLPNFRGESLVTTYIYRIAVNVAQNEWKRRKRMDRPLVSISEETSAWGERLEHPDRNAEQQMEEREFRLRLEEHLKDLSNVERTVLVLYHQEERSYEQIAAALGMPIGTIRTHLHRGRKKLRERLQERSAACPVMK
ncbi:RNA polymerase sigma factor [Edaphobacter modestus]|uniref:RNA polymerase sigma-70 factor (ECF subfamily) n=1 Tax=Edaphobacter modestus TaxID=388466 RepID=A0A4Q7Z181_9BACT|nr:sigma-70 family RNA polymerase sigma factor [Edaphobacter modestus]RZU43391.1 RNA polymerase sigma-70 factor (ECF subfamily) [Edaphobacter modestus]